MALASFERGISHALGFGAASEAFVLSTAAHWLSLAAPAQKPFLEASKSSSGASAAVRISRQEFFDFCTNRQHVVRRLLEALDGLVSEEADDNADEVEEVAPGKISVKPPSGGDEWLANPAWKKTAEKMVPAAYKGQDKDKDGPPDASLALEWVHGYRGFDCRNNLFLVDEDVFLFHAAGLVVAQSLPSSSKSPSQSFLNLHTDDVTCVSVWRGGAGARVASGEIGKTPVIHVSVWTRGAGGAGSFSPPPLPAGLPQEGSESAGLLDPRVEALECRRGVLGGRL